MGIGNRWEELKRRKLEGKHVSGDLEGLVTGGIGGSFRGSVASPVSDRSPNPVSGSNPRLKTFLYFGSGE